jgi:hypothetical protein
LKKWIEKKGRRGEEKRRGEERRGEERRGKKEMNQPAVRSHSSFERALSSLFQFSEVLSQHLK